MDELLHADITYKIRGSLFTVYNTLGFGHKEQIYQKALEKELRELSIHFQREPSLKVEYKGEKIGLYKPDFLVEDKVIVELKAVEFMAKSFELQLIHYLKSTNYQVGILVNFGSPQIYIKRLVWSKTYPSISVKNP